MRSERGYGLNSFRLYEAMQLGAIPVIVTDAFYLPWTDELDWSEFAVLIPEASLAGLEAILLSYSDDRISSMRKKLANVWRDYFSMDGLYRNIIKRIK
ncbi:MAG: exostosin family protein [Pirellulaceae bacterium]|nr:exostosin family protein [Pirellulaceae bacterium]